LYLTRAPDYAQWKMEVDGQASSPAPDGFAPKVMPPGPMQMGKFSLNGGPRRISFMIVGKYAQSTGYLVGIDRIRLYPAGP
jgi:hypothetical protein